MIKTFACLVCVWTGAWALREHSVYLDYYYSIMVLLGVIIGGMTRSFAYTGLMLLLVAIYALENNSQLWHVDMYMLAIMYALSAVTVLIFQTDDGLKASYIISGLLVSKCLVAITMDNGYLLHTVLNALSIAQWVTFASIASMRIKLNRGYGKKDNPFMLRVGWIQRKTGILSMIRLETTKSG